MKILELYKHLSGLYPERLSAPWDNDGIMCLGDLNKEASKILVSVDASDGAVEYAARNSYDAVLTHHPMIFRGLKRIVAGDAVSDRVVKAVTGGIAVLSFHTRLDSAYGGVNDALAARLGFSMCERFGDEESPELGRIGVLEKPVDSMEFAGFVKKALGCAAVRVTGSGKIKRVAMVGGDGKDFIRPAMKYKADAIVTGDAGYNAAQDAAEEGFCTIEAGHYHTEAPVCHVLVEILRGLGIDADIYNSCAYIVV